MDPSAAHPGAMFDSPSTPPDASAGRDSLDGAEPRERQSPVELTHSRENSVHGPSASDGALMAMTPEMQLALYPLFFCEERHESADFHGDAGAAGDDEAEVVSKWRMKDRMKTMSVALILCLNIGVDPPDVLKISPCARMQCWINPLSMQPQKALDAIGKALQAQYERWQPRAKYKLQLDPTVEDVKKLCASCRRNAKNERVLLHYNGHGVPRPTVNGEVWVFNKSYTQYIPLSVYDLQQWTGNPAIYVFDCSGAGLVVNAFLQMAEHGGLSGGGAPGVNAAANQRVSGSGAAAEALNAASAARAARQSAALHAADTMGGAMPLGSGMRECILLAACGAEELLPQSAELPADVFSACLTTPIKIALQWFCSRSILKNDGISADIIDKIPGQQNNRKTPLGELNWIFTAITDTIAWNVLPRPLFQRLFRQDLLVASLFRNFLLAERVMRANNCAPVSSPRLPPTYQHPMWHAWDMAVETCLLQMPALVAGDGSAEFAPSPFFTEQLTAFEVWLEHGSERKPPPEQLPIVLQVLLSQSHRLRALVLLGRFLDKGPWAVDLALSVGIFPYVLKLLQTTAPDLRQILVFIWTKILALDRSCQADLVKDSSHAYFIRFLDAPRTPSEERAMAAFVLAAICDDHPKGQAACADSGLLQVVLGHLPAAAGPGGSPLLLRWLCLCAGKLWENFEEAQRDASARGAAETLASLVAHPVPDVRAAAVFALGATVYVPTEGDEAGAEGAGSSAADSTATSTSNPNQNLPPDPSRGGEPGGEPGGAPGDAPERGPNNPPPPPPPPPPAPPSSSAGSLRVAEELATASKILPCAEDASPLVREEAAAALGRLAAARGASFRAAASRWLDRVGGPSRSSSARGREREHPSHRRHHSVSSVASRSSEGGGGGGGGSGAFGSGAFGSGAFGSFGARTPVGSVPEDDASPGGGGGGGSEADAAASSSGGTLSADPAAPAPDDGSSSSPTAPFGPYWHVLRVLAELAEDPAPRVVHAARRAILAAGLSPAHPLLAGFDPGFDPAAAGLPNNHAAGGFSDGFDARRDRRGANVERGGSHAGAHGTDPAAGDPSSRGGSRRGSDAFGRGGRTPSWHQKLSNAAARILGSPGRRAARNGGGGGDAGAGGSDDANGDAENMRRSVSALRLASPLSRGDPRGDGMKRVATAHAALKQMSSPRGEHASFPPAFAADTPDAGNSPRAPGAAARSEGTAGAALGGVDSREERAEWRGGTGGGTASARSRVPGSRIFAWSREHFSRSLLEPPAGAHGYEGGYDDDDRAYGFGGIAPAHRRLDPRKRLARRRVVEENARRSGRARREQLKLTEHLASIDMDSGATPTRIVMHPLTPTAAVADDRGCLRVWDYQTGRVLNRFGAGFEREGEHNRERGERPASAARDARGGRDARGASRDAAASAGAVASLQLMNDLDDSLLLAGAGDGRVRVWRDYARQGEEKLVTALRALPKPPGARRAGFHASRSFGAASPRLSSRDGFFEGGGGGSHPEGFDRTSNARGRRSAAVVWQQQSGCLYACGDSDPGPLLRVWDMTRETRLESLATPSPGTCLTAEGALLMAGAADGAVLSYDLRTPARLLSAVQTHRREVVAILLQPGNTGNLVVTGSVDGEMKFCDLRNAAKPFHTARVMGNNTPNGGGAHGERGGSGGAHGERGGSGGGARGDGSDAPHLLSALVAHSHSAIIASGSAERAVKLWDLEGNVVAAVKHYGSFLGQRIGAVRSLAFHPNSLLLAVGSADGIATVYTTENPEASRWS